MLDFASKVLTVFQADTSDMKAKLRELQGEEKKLQEQQLRSAEDRNKGLDTWVERLGNANQALALVSTGIGVAADAWKSYADHLRLTSAAGSANIESLRRASLGLRTEHELLSFAAQTQHGVIKANQTQMEVAQRAMVALTRAGFDQEEVTKKVTDAMVSLKVNGLDDFGITVQKGKTDLETYSNLMAELGKKASGVDDSHQTASEGIAQFGVTLTDAVDKMKHALGELVASLEPVISGFAAAAGMAAKLVEILPKGGIGKYAGGVLKHTVFGLPGMIHSAYNYFGGGPEATAVPGIDAQSEFNEFGERNAPFDITSAIGADVSTPEYGTFAQAMGFDYRQFGEADGKTSERLKARLQAMEEAAKAYAEWRKRMLGIGKSLLGAESPADRAIRAGAADRAAFAAGVQSDVEQMYRDEAETRRRSVDFGGATENITGLSQPLKDMQDALREINEKRQQSLLESAFGPVEEFDVYKEAFQSLGSVMEGFSSGLQASFKAIGDGSLSVGGAFKKGLGIMVTGIGDYLAAQSGRHFVESIAHLALLDFSGAARHGAAGAIYGAGAIAAYAAATKLGGSGSTAAGGASRSNGTADHRQGAGGGGSTGRGGSEIVDPTGTGTRTSNGNNNIVVVYADPFADGNPGTRRRNAQKVIERARGGRDWDNS